MTWDSKPKDSKIFLSKSISTHWETPVSDEIECGIHLCFYLQSSSIYRFLVSHLISRLCLKIYGHNFSRYNLLSIKESCRNHIILPFYCFHHYQRVLVYNTDWLDHLKLHFEQASNTNSTHFIKSSTSMESINKSIFLHKSTEPKQNLLLDIHYKVFDPILSCSHQEKLPLFYSSQMNEHFQKFKIWDLALSLCVVPQDFNFPKIIGWCASHYSVQNQSIISHVNSKILLTINTEEI